MIKQKNTAWWFKLNAILRYAMIHSMAKYLPLFIVNEYPRSGGTWISQMISDSLNIPFPRNRLPVFRSSVMHVHTLHCWNMHNMLIVWRDGRDILVSQYYHFLFENDCGGNSYLVERCRSELGFSDYQDIEKNIVPFMEFVFEKKRIFRFSWSDFVNKWIGYRCAVHVKYEEMREHPCENLKCIVEKMAGSELAPYKMEEIVEKYSFKKISGRSMGQENTKSFLRKGVVGDWKNYFNKEARKKFNMYAGAALIELAYEDSERWV